MAVPKRNDKLIQHLMKSQKTESTKLFSFSEESEFRALQWDINKGIKLPPYKINRYMELKKKLGK